MNRDPFAFGPRARLARIVGVAAAPVRAVASVLAAASVLTTQPLSAQSRTIALDDAISLAAQRAPLVAYAAGLREAARGRARVDGSFPNPVIEWRRENDRTPIAPDIFVTATLPIDVTGRRFGLRAAGEALVARTAADSAALARDVMVDAARTWWRAALARELALIAREQEVALAGIAAFDATRLREGSVAPVVAIRAQLEADRARLVRVAAEADAARAQAEFARALGFGADSAPVPAALAAGERRQPGRVDEPAPIAALRDAPSRRPVIVDDPALADAVRGALTRRPEVVARTRAVEEARLRLTAERRGVLGDLALVGGTKRTAGYDGVLFGVTMPFPLFSVNGGARQRALGELQQAEAELREARNRVAADVAGAVHAAALQRAAAAIRADDLGARGAEIATIAEAAYREGGISQLELLEARRASADARAAALRWLVDQQLTRLELRRAMGAPILEAAP